MMNCPYCGKLTDPKLDNCPHCGGYMKKQRSSASVSDAGRRQTCPSCHALVQDGDIICVNCGTNLLTGQKIADERKALPDKKSFSLAKLAVGVIAIAAVILAAVWVLRLQRDPILRAKELARTGKLSEATQLLTDYVAAHPDHAAAQYQLGILQWYGSQYRPAAEAFEAAARLAPNNRDAYVLAALSQAGVNDAGSAQKVAGILERMVNQFPDDAEAWLLLGLARGVTGDYEQQASALQKALALEPGMTAAHEYLGLAMALQGNYQGAEEHLNAALKAYPDNGDLQAAKGILSTVQGRTEDAVSLLSGALKANTGIRGIALTQLGKALVAQGNFKGALEHLMAASTNDPKNMDAKFYLAVAQRALGLTDEAVGLFNEVIAAGGPKAADSAAIMAEIHLERQDVQRAKEAVSQAISLGGQGAPLFTIQGRVNSAAGDINGARAAFDKALQSDVSYAPAYLEYGLFHITRENSFSEGIRKLKRYLEILGPNTPSANRNRIESLIKQLEQTSGSAPAAPEAEAASPGVVS